eukprot:jgi/Tetstr1/463619/TSEL_008481.t1
MASAASAAQEMLPHDIQEDSKGVQLLVGPLPAGTTGAQVLVEMVQERLLEVSLEGGGARPLSFELPRGVTEEHLQVKFSKKRAQLTVTWPRSADSSQAAPSSPMPTTGQQDPLPEAITAEVPAPGGGTAMEAAAAGCSGEDVAAPGAQAAADTGAAPAAGAVVAAAPTEAPPTTGGKKKKGRKKGGKIKGAGKQAQGGGEVAGLEDLEATADALAEQLLARGYAYVDNFLAPGVVGSILKETAPLHEYYEPGEIWVGKEAQAGAQVARGDVRGDSILWLNFQTMISNNCMSLHRAMRRMDTLVMSLLPRRVPRLAHVSEHSDAMLSLYPPPSGRFQKHIDNTARDGRCLTVLLYLNPGWEAASGGALRLWPLQTGHVQGSLITTAAQTLSRGEGAEPVDLLPVAGRLAMFYSDRVLHEVLPTHKLRHAVTQWYYDRVERAEALVAAAGEAETKRGRRAGGGGGVDAQGEAHAFIRALMVDTSEPSPRLLAQLVQQAEALSPDALRMAAEIMGAGTPQDLVTAVRSFTPKSLTELRGELTRMGQ